MRTQNLSPLWATEYVSEIVDGETVGAYTNLQEFSGNIQTDYSELDLQEYGETVNELIKIRAEHEPPLKKGDYIYLSCPPKQGVVAVNGVDIPDYGQGDYRVESIKPAFIGVDVFRNPTVIVARLVTKND